jgi:hypothetical protein
MASSKDTEKVIAHFLDGTLLRGTVPTFYPGRPKFELIAEDGARHKLHITELKALFFVREFAGRPEYRERKGFFGENGSGSKILVEFFDGEVLFGHSLTYSPKGNGFFMTPGDPDSNNLKVFVVHASTKRVKIKLAERPARKTRTKKTRRRARTKSGT